MPAKKTMSQGLVAGNYFCFSKIVYCSVSKLGTAYKQCIQAAVFSFIATITIVNAGITIYLSLHWIVQFYVTISKSLLSRENTVELA